MDSLYSVKQASDLTGISKPALRQYTEKYQKWLSAEAIVARLGRHKIANLLS